MSATVFAVFSAWHRRRLFQLFPQYRHLAFRLLCLSFYAHRPARVFVLATAATREPPLSHTRMRSRALRLRSSSYYVVDHMNRLAS